MYLRAPRPRLRANLRHLGNPRGILRSRSCRSIARARTQGVRPPLLRQPRALWRHALERAPHLRPKTRTYAPLCAAPSPPGEFSAFGEPVWLPWVHGWSHNWKNFAKSGSFSSCATICVFGMRRGAGYSLAAEVRVPLDAEVRYSLPTPRRRLRFCRCGEGRSLVIAVKAALLPLR